MRVVQLIFLSILNKIHVNNKHPYICVFLLQNCLTSAVLLSTLSFSQKNLVRRINIYFHFIQVLLCITETLLTVLMNQITVQSTEAIKATGSIYIYTVVTGRWTHSQCGVTETQRGTKFVVAFRLGTSLYYIWRFPWTSLTQPSLKGHAKSVDLSQA